MPLFSQSASGGGKYFADFAKIPTWREKVSLFMCVVATRARAL
jgi:hypothetical protein